MSDKYTWSDVKYSDNGLMNAAKMLGLANLNFSSGLDSIKNAMDSNLLTQAANVKAKREFDTNQALASLLPNLGDPLKFQNTLNSDAFKTMTENGSIDAKTLTDAIAKGSLVVDSNQRAMSLFEKDKADQSNNALMGQLLSNTDMADPNNAANAFKQYASNFNPAGTPILNTLSSFFADSAVGIKNSNEPNLTAATLADMEARRAHTTAQTNSINALLPEHINQLKAQTEETKNRTDAAKVATGINQSKHALEAINQVTTAAQADAKLQRESLVNKFRNMTTQSGLNFDSYYKTDKTNNTISMNGVTDNFNGAFSYLEKMHGKAGQNGTPKETDGSGDAESLMRTKLMALEKHSNTVFGITTEGGLVVNPTEKVAASAKLGELPPHVLLALARTGLVNTYDYWGLGNTPDGMKEDYRYYNRRNDSFNFDRLIKNKEIAKTLTAEIGNLSTARTLLNNHQRQMEVISQKVGSTTNNAWGAISGIQNGLINDGANATNANLNNAIRNAKKIKK